jgi:hypothetical protein
LGQGQNDCNCTKNQAFVRCIDLLGIRGMFFGLGALLAMLVGLGLISFTIAGDDDDGTDVSL